MQEKMDEQTKELEEAKTETVEMVTPETYILQMYLSTDEINQIQETKAEISPWEKTLKMQDKLCVNRLIQLVVSQAIEKVSSKYKLFTERLTPDCISDRLIQKIWPEIETMKHLDLSPKRLKNLDNAIIKDLCVAHNCKEKYLIFNLREQLDNFTVPTFTKHLFALPRRVLSVSKNREEYKEVVKNVIEDVVMHTMNQRNKSADPDIVEFTIQRLNSKMWSKIVSKNYRMSLENIEQLSLTIYTELQETWPPSILRSSNSLVDKLIMATFKKHAKLRRQNIIFRAFSCAH
ncbi:unnamed protein product [Oreochromis niloticus]|nr:unnamed protein product [Mustela putorius furo]